MAELSNGMLVKHASLGVGKVVAVDAKAVHVFFATSTTRFATKLRLPMALPLLAPATDPNAWLSGLSGFSLDAKSGRFARAGTWLSHEEATARFVEVYPGAFGDAGYAGDGKAPHPRAFRWRRAHDVFEETLGRGEGERLLAAGELDALVDRVVRIERQVRALHKEPKDGAKLSLEDGLADRAAARGFFTALFALLAEEAPAQARFEALAAATAALFPAAPAESLWPLVTLLPFLARPDLHVLLRPRFVCAVAQRLGLELAYDATPNWRTYAALLEASALLLERLRSLGARDHVDVDAFMHVVAAKHAAPKAVAAAGADLHLVT